VRLVRNGGHPAGGRQRLPTLALLAHDAKKHDLLRLARAHHDLVRSVHLVATGGTGMLLTAELQLPVERLASGATGGDLQIGALIVDGGVDGVIFLRDPLTPHPHEPDVHTLLRVCDIRQVPVATNLASAEILLHAMAESTLVPSAPCSPFESEATSGQRSPPQGGSSRALRSVPAPEHA
jgi:methylglyoxal synthase